MNIVNIKFLKQNISQFGIIVMVLVGAGHDDGDGGSPYPVVAIDVVVAFLSESKGRTLISTV